MSSVPVINFPEPMDPQHLQGVAMLMVKTPKDNMEEIDHKEAKKERVEHKGINLGFVDKSKKVKKKK